MTEVIQVVAGILIDADDRVLLAERLASKSHMAGYWEFPGGKLEPGEGAFEALCRELHEELAIEVGAAKPYMQLKHDYSNKSVALDFWRVIHWRGEPQSAEGQALAWVPRAQLADQDILPADKPLIARLQGGN